LFFTVKDIKKISNDIYQYRVELEQKYQSGLSLRENIQKLVEVRPTIELLEKSFVEHLDTLVFVNDIETEADKLGIKQIINIPEIEIETVESKKYGSEVMNKMQYSKSRLICCVIGQDCQDTIGMCLESVKDSDEVVYLDGGSTDETIGIFSNFLPSQEGSKSTFIVNIFDKEDSNAISKQRNFYLEYLKKII